jgi:urease accessory protein
VSVRVRSRVEIVADVTGTGRTVLPGLRSDGALAARVTGPGVVHLVGTAAGPLGGDDVEIRVIVRAGAHLTLRGAAATLALPGRTGAPAEWRVELLVEDGATLVQALPPLVVCRGALLRTQTRLCLAGTAAADLTELVVLGRHAEEGGTWTGRLVADRDDLPVLRTTQTSGVLRLGGDPPRALLTRLLTRPERSGPGSSPAWTEALTVGGAVRCPLATGDVLVTAIGPDAGAVTTDAGAVVPVPASTLDQRRRGRCP